MAHQLVLILDFGSQYTQLIARRIREHAVYCEVHPHSLSLERMRALAPAAVVLSGGPSSCYAPGAPQVDAGVFDLGVPVLGICYGAQITARMLGGDVKPSDKREYGRAVVRIKQGGAGVLRTIATGDELAVWMSHGDSVDALPPGFVHTAESDNCAFAAFADVARKIHCVQFHPEVVHTPRGAEILAGFLFGVAGLAGDWSMASFADEAVARIRAQVGPEGRVICGLSGGVDSSVAAAILHKAIGDRLTCIFVDNGLLRRGEREQVAAIFNDHFHVDLRVVDATDRFLDALAGVTDPERKRKIIGHEFINVFDDEAKTIANARFLAQGTLYPDVIESVSVRGPAAVIKSHHNVGGLPERMQLTLVEPLRELFKDEVRLLGTELGLPRRMISRQPFPGPGLAVRCLGDLTRPRLDTLRGADAIVEEEIRAAGLYEAIWQAFAVLLPVRSVGVMGDDRTYDEAMRDPRRDLARRHDRRLGAAAPRSAGADVEPHHQRGARRQPRGLRHHVEAAGDDRVGVAARALVLLALATAPAAATPLVVAVAPGVTLDWSRGALVATGVGPADRNAPSPTVARVGAARAAEQAARAALAAAVAQVPAVGGRFDPRTAAVARELALAPVVAIARGTDGSARVTVALGLEALRQARSGPRPVAGDDGALVTAYVDARRLPVAPAVGLAVVHGGDRWAGPTRFVAAVPDGVVPMIAIAASTDGLTVPNPVAGSAAVVVVVPPDP